jgi:hypothetical protein
METVTFYNTYIYIWCGWWNLVAVILTSESCSWRQLLSLSFLTNNIFLDCLVAARGALHSSFVLHLLARRLEQFAAVVVCLCMVVVDSPWLLLL